jgi:hypothetical protein
LKGIAKDTNALIVELKPLVVELRMLLEQKRFQ